MFEFLLWLFEGNEKLWLHVVWSSSTKQASFAFDLNVPVPGEKERFAFLLQFSVSYQLSMLISFLQGGNVEIQPGPLAAGCPELAMEQAGADALAAGVVALRRARTFPLTWRHRLQAAVPDCNSSRTRCMLLAGIGFLVSKIVAAQEES